jgi:hypothetical protein
MQTTTAPDARKRAEDHENGSGGAAVSTAPGDSGVADTIRDRTQFAAHGNWGGPGWSAGKFTRDPDWSVPAADGLDEIYKMHDHDYGTMPRPMADALLIRRLRQYLTAGGEGFVNNAKARASIAAFKLLNVGKTLRSAEPGRAAYPWTNEAKDAKPRKRVRFDWAGPDNPPPQYHFRPSALATPAHAPPAVTATTMAVEPNPGPPKRAKSAKGRRRKTKRPARRAASAKGRRAPRMPITILANSQRRRKTKASTVGTASKRMRWTGKDLVYIGVADFTNAANQVPGVVVWSCPLTPINAGSPASSTPQGLPSLAANQMCTFWEKFRFLKLRVTVKGTGNKFTSGRYVVGFEQDVTDDEIASVPGVQRLLRQGGRSVTIPDGGSVDLPREFVPKDFLFLQPNGSDLRITTQGKIWVITEEPAQAYASSGSSNYVKAPLEVYIDWLLEFSGPTLEPVAGGSLVPQPVSMTWKQSTSAALGTDPLNVGQLATWWNNGATTKYAASNGIIIAYDGTYSYVLFPDNSPWDLITTANYALGIATSNASPVLNTGGCGGATFTNGQGATQNSTGIATNGTIALATTLSTISSISSMTAAYQYWNNSWTTLVGFGAINTWGGIRITGTLSTATLTFFTIAGVVAYTPDIADKMALHGGPCTTHGMALESWDMTTSFVEHTKRFAAAREAKQTQVLELAAENARLRRQLALSDDDYDNLRRHPSPTPTQGVIYFRDGRAVRPPDDAYDRLESKTRPAK